MLVLPTRPLSVEQAALADTTTLDKVNPPSIITYIPSLISFFNLGHRSMYVL